MRATTSGWEIVCPQPIGSGTFSHASARWSGGTNASRGTLRTARSTRSSSTAARSSSSSASAGLRDPGARGPDLLERTAGVPRLDLDPADRGAVDRDREALLDRLERRLLDAVVRREPDDRQLADPALVQQLGEVRAVEARVALGGRILALVDDDVDLRRVQRRVQLRALG